MIDGGSCMNIIFNLAIVKLGLNAELLQPYNLILISKNFHSLSSFLCAYSLFELSLSYLL